MSKVDTTKPAPVSAQRAPGPDADGYIDTFGYVTNSSGWAVIGWVGHGWDDLGATPTVRLEFTDGEISGPCECCTFPRADVKNLGVGIVIIVESAEQRRTQLTDVLLTISGRAFRLMASAGTVQTGEEKLLPLLKELVTNSPRSTVRTRLLQRFNRPQWTGSDTLARLPWPIFMEVDAAHLCPPTGLLLRGWFADPFEQVAKIRVRSGAASHPLNPADWIALPRPDVAGPLREKHGLVNDKCGFIAYVPAIFNPREAVYFEMETVAGDVAHKRIPPPQSTGLAAIKDLLGTFDLTYDELARAFNGVVGPAIAAMNEFRLQRRPTVQATDFGERPKPVRSSIIVPLYGRMDFLEYQLAFFSRTLSPEHELIYVLDDPNRKREVEQLAASCLARFERPFKLVMPSQNVGYGPANNIGLRHVRGEFVCFLNSDVFPETPDWLEHMLETATRPGVGMVGALLLFEDGTVQHEGVTYKKLPQLGGWDFCMHPNKGRYPAPIEDRQMVPAVTGACMVMRSSLALELGGFDEGFVIGDFEDTDLCKRVQQRGLTCMVDRRARLFHLERQSQGDQAQTWRMNLTLYNAWRFHRKWGAADV